MATSLQLQAFLAVVDHGGFTAASRMLGLSQPAVSRAVAGLERELGLPLLRRKRDGVTLNQAGSRAVLHAREAVRHLDQMRAETAAAAGEFTGTLRVASLPFITGLLLAPHLRTFADHHPFVDIRVLEGGEQEIRDWLDQGAAEAGVVSLPAHGLSTTCLGDQDMVAVVPAGHPLAAHAEVSYADLAKEPFVRTTGDCALVFLAMARRIGVELDTAFKARDVNVVLEIVRAGLGVSILPIATVLDPPPDIAVRPLVPKTIRRLAVAVSASAGTAARAFLDQIATRPQPIDRHQSSDPQSHIVVTNASGTTQMRYTS
ncbi:LysR family transcriptional regulator [Mycobacterium kubicae]|uniref:LysR family transcriptional regulator n=1 Tax=Mycobacterium kubicae TaxID=120959 RepID=UPI0007FBDFC4|nr:LysR family transcriptional regulator [Mycobacterium kubicae]OBK49066.1 LysR family transcriptional regulator [Mycobacterium kubicae]